ncbi:hypothetical protein NCCP2222_19380 [Sporosarcina sp. NCCP-2222]|uniref:hypothetical protein n=1 Tax=Sporosarcina sp. NCCP-2222 TaxID=2935073 RepID=UPI0020804B28|nr:hypothetical protein [Sporosarcina sp. NCCP-2222]GKV55991.1 hypothetical protein NCCP2222_19380 [Sporosarcina sp. NCCP-2222]
MASAARHEDAHVLLEGMVIKWYWSKDEIIEFRKLWRAGVDVESIAEKLNTNSNSIALLVMDQAMTDVIKPRPGGLFG